MPGAEVALEGMLKDGAFQLLAFFDKPDPLDGPHFEETIYVTPSRLPRKIQTRALELATEAVRCLGLRNGPVHVEMRVYGDSPATGRLYWDDGESFDYERGEYRWFRLTANPKDEIHSIEPGDGSYSIDVDSALWRFMTL